MASNDRKIKVLFSSFQSNLSGAPRALFHIVNELDKLRFDCHVIFSNKGPIVNEFMALAPTYIISPYKNKRLPARMTLKIRDYQFQRDMDRLLQLVQPDVLYVNTVGENLVSRFALHSTLPTIVHYHEIDHTVMSLPDKWRQSLQQATLSIGCSQAVSDFIMRVLCIPAGQVLTFPESIPVRHLPQRVNQTRKQLLDSVNIPDEAVILGTVGKPSFRKGADIFVEAARIVLEKHTGKDIHFVWVGGNDYVHNSLFMQCVKQNTIKYGLTGKVHWVGEVNSATSWVSAFDAYIVSSREDPFPLGMLEAMALARPMVGFAISGVPEAIGDTGSELVNGVSAPRLAGGILNLLDRQDKWPEIGAKTQQKAANYFDITTNISTIEEAISRVVALTAQPT